VILPPNALVEWYAAVASHHRRVALCDAAEVRRCCIRAATLAEDDLSAEPAAMFFVFADRRRAVTSAG
jgi:hypothetical protein